MKTVIEMAREAGIEWDLIDKDEGQIWYITQAGLVRFAELVRADEREACAKFFDNNDTNMFWGSQAAQHIRARSNT